MPQPAPSRDDRVPSGVQEDGRAASTAEIAASLRGEVTPALRAKLEDALRRWPGDLRLKMLQGEMMERTGEPDRALACFRALQRDHPGNPWPSLRLARAQLAQGQVAPAIETFVATVWGTALPEPEITRLLNGIVTVLPNQDERQAFLEGLLSGAASDRFVLVKLGAITFRRGDRPGAVRLFDRAAALGPIPEESRPLHLELLMIAGRVEEALALALDILAERPDRRDIARRAILAARLSRRTDRLVEVLRASLARWPEDWLLVYRYNRAACPFDVDRALFEHLSGYADANLADDRWAFQFAHACLRHQETGRALAILRRLAPDSPVAHLSRPLGAVLSARPDEAWCNPRGVSNDPADDVQIRSVPEARATLIVLTGVQGTLGPLPYSHADVLLCGLRANVVYLRDRRELAYTGGVVGLGADEADSIARLRQICTELGDVPVIAMGASLGGASAVRLACLMGAQAAISFAGPLQWSAGEVDDESEAATRSHLRNTIFTTITQSENSLLDYIAQSPDTLVHHCYGADCAVDARNARLLERLGNVRLEAVSGCADHEVMSHMVGSGAFERLLARLIGD